MSTVHRHLAFLDSELAATAVARSTFDVQDALKPGTSIFIEIPSELLDAQRGLLRCWLATMIRVIGSTGDERKGQVLCLLDEASALNGLGAIEEALVRGRSAGVRLLLAYQSDSQVKAAFKDKPSLVYDNCSAHIYLGATSIETAERLSKSLGDWTQVVTSGGDSESKTYQGIGASANGNNDQVNRGFNRGWQTQGRALMRPEELLVASRELLFALVAGMPPIRARRVRWFAGSLFGTAPARGHQTSVVWWALLTSAVVLIAWGLFGAI
ncbi:MAG: type IV secretory system conjugative DNA transfer family protein [Planctomycetota bacterium]|nr:type IV secretory system conjugative DNA transfer family protein [Planctomycetota bacterium]